MANNPNNTIEITLRDKWSLESKAKRAWRCFFIQRDKIHELQTFRDELIEEVAQLRTANETPTDYEHLKKMFLELYDKVGEMCDCPICFEAMRKDNTDVPLCGHLVCKECRTRITECPVCKRKY